MQITLIRTGGIIPMKKSAQIDVPWTKEEMEHLLKKISRENKTAGAARDNTGYQIVYNGKTTPVDLEKLPEAYKKIFDELKDNLEIVKE